MQEDIVRNFALIFSAFPTLWAVTERVNRLETGETNFLSAENFK